MTTNQTIDGVPRAWLEEYESLADLTSGDAQMLRALLDAPQVESELSRMTRRCQNAELALKVQTENCEALKAAQPQGEPVAWVVQCKTSGLLENAEPGEKATNPRYFTDAFPVFREAPAIKLHVNVSNVKVTLSADGSYSIDPVERPAPVAVALSDPGPDQQVEARAKEIYEGWSYNPGFAPWVDGGNSIMQSKARDLARRELAPVAAAQTCCGSCPGGCVYGLKA